MHPREIEVEFRGCSGEGFRDEVGCWLMEWNADA